MEDPLLIRGGTLMDGTSEPVLARGKYRADALAGRVLRASTR